MSEAEAEPVAAEPEAAEAPAAEPEAAAEPAAEPEAAAEPEPEPEAQPEPAAEPEQEEEEEVAAADMYKNAPHKETQEGAPFDHTTDGCHPYHDREDCKLSEHFDSSSTLWVCYAACHPKDGFLEFVGKGDSVAELKASLDGNRQMFYLLKCKARDVKNNVVSERCRKIRICQLGSTVPVMKRRFKTDSWKHFENATQGCSKDYQFDETDACDWKSWMEEIRKIGGAHQPTEYKFGPEESWKP